MLAQAEAAAAAQALSSEDREHAPADEEHAPPDLPGFLSNELEQVTTTRLRLAANVTLPSGVVIGSLHAYHAPSGLWGRVCSGAGPGAELGTGVEEAHVACRQMGFATGITQSIGNFRASPQSLVPFLKWFSGTDRYSQLPGDAAQWLALLDGVRCEGSEADIAQCQHSPWRYIRNCAWVESTIILACVPHGKYVHAGLARCWVQRWQAGRHSSAHAAWSLRPAWSAVSLDAAAFMSTHVRMLRSR